MLIAELGDLSVNIRAARWTYSRRANVFAVHRKVIVAIMSTLLENGIDLSCPMWQILLRDRTEERGGDRARQRERWPAGRGAVPNARPLGAPKPSGCC